MCVQWMDNEFYLFITHQNDVAFLFKIFPIKVEQLALLETEIVSRYTWELMLG